MLLVLGICRIVGHNMKHSEESLMFKDGLISNVFMKYILQVSSQCWSNKTTCAAIKHKNRVVPILHGFFLFFMDLENELRDNGDMSLIV